MSEPGPETALTFRYQAVLANIRRAAQEAGRRPEDINLVIASKTQPACVIEKLIILGHRLFGENRVQEAQQKWPLLKKKYPDVSLHLIGPLQTNKARDALNLFDVIETVDREKLARVLADEERKLGLKRSHLIEVNIGSEEQKSGVLPEAAGHLVALCRYELELDICGLMSIPPAGQQAAPYFATLARLANENGLTQKSMGMTADYQMAIAMGATHVRVGTAIFGPRQAIE